MKAQQILAEIRSRSEGNKFSWLKRVQDLIQENRNGTNLVSQKARAWDLVELLDKLLGEKLHIGLFVAAKDGKPLKEPTYTKSDGNFEGSFEYQKSIILYKKAQQEVIFEGWEVLEQDSRVFNNETEVITLKSKDNPMTLEFYYDENGLLLDVCVYSESNGVELSTNPPLSDLAEATQSNPLKLK
jgi:hypothetical protein